jgi:hypothetical protein
MFDEFAAECSGLGFHSIRNESQAAGIENVLKNGNSGRLLMYEVI